MCIIFYRKEILIDEKDSDTIKINRVSRISIYIFKYIFGERRACHDRSKMFSINVCRYVCLYRITMQRCIMRRAWRTYWKWLQWIWNLLPITRFFSSRIKFAFPKLTVKAQNCLIYKGQRGCRRCKKQRNRQKSGSTFIYWLRLSCSQVNPVRINPPRFARSKYNRFAARRNKPVLIFPTGIYSSGSVISR